MFCLLISFSDDCFSLSTLINCLSNNFFDLKQIDSLELDQFTIESVVLLLYYGYLPQRMSIQVQKIKFQFFASPNDDFHGMSDAFIIKISFNDFKIGGDNS